MASLLFLGVAQLVSHIKESPAMESSEKPSIWHSFSSERRKERNERRAGTNTRSTPSRFRGRSNISNTTSLSGIHSSDLPPPYSEAEIPAITISGPEEPESESQYSFLRDFDTVFLVDDSSSMQGRLWKEAEEAIAAIAPICTTYDSDGIDIYFLNHRPPSYESNYTYHRQRSQPSADGYHNVTTAQRVSEIFATVRPRGGTAVGHRLHDILDPYMRRVQAMHAAKLARGATADAYVKPINIITITDGVFTDDAEGVIIKTAKMLDGPTCDALPWQVGIQFFQIGNDEAAREELEGLDDHLGARCQDANMRDIVDTVSWKNRAGARLNGDGILKTVLGAVNKRLDRRRV